jgi:hypothetical protein
MSCQANSQLCLGDHASITATQPTGAGRNPIRSPQRPGLTLTVVATGLMLGSYQR